MRNRMWAGAAAIVAVVIVIAALISPHWGDDFPDNAAFTIGTQTVTPEDLDRRNDSLRALYGVQEPSEKSERAEFQRQAAKSMAMSIVLDDAARRAGITVSDEQVDGAVQTFIRDQFGGDRSAFREALGSVNTSERAVVAEIRRQLELRQLLTHVAGDISITNSQVSAAFEERRGDLGLPERREVSNIVTTTRAESDRVRRRLEAGDDIGALARQYSVDGATRESGGQLGLVARGDLLGVVGDAAFGVSTGAVYGPVQGDQGWNVGTVTRIVPAVAATLDGVRESLRKTLIDEEAQRRWVSWLREQLRSADIEYAADFRPDKLYDVSAWAGSLPSEGSEEPR